MSITFHFSPYPVLSPLSIYINCNFRNFPVFFNFAPLFPTATLSFQVFTNILLAEIFWKKIEQKNNVLSPANQYKHITALIWKTIQIYSLGSLILLYIFSFICQVQLHQLTKHEVSQLLGDCFSATGLLTRFSPNTSFFSPPPFFLVSRRNDYETKSELS